MACKCLNSVVKLSNMKIVIGTQFFSSLLFFLHKIVSINAENTNLFLVRPGDGEKYVYSPVDVNATLHCAVNNTRVYV